jgi:serine/threonine-protein kinase HipA
LVQILKLLDGSDSPAEDHATILKAQILFWLIGATDGHAKNFSIFLSPGGGFRLTPLYDVLTAQPSLDAGQIERRQFRLAMSVGTSRHYRIEEIVGRHFVQSGEAAGLPRTLIREALERMADKAGKAVDEVEQSLPGDFPMQIHRSVKAGLEERLKRLAVL